MLRVTTEYGLCKRAAAPPATDKLAAGLARCTRADRVWANDPVTAAAVGIKPSHGVQTDSVRACSRQVRIRVRTLRRSCTALLSLASGRQCRGLLRAVGTAVAIEAMAGRVAPDAVATTVPTAHRLRAVAFFGRDRLDQLPQPCRGVRERRIDLLDRHVSDSRIPPDEYSLHVRKLKGDLELSLQMLQVEEGAGIPRGCVAVPLPGEGDDAELRVSRSVRSRDKPLCLSQVASDVRRIQVWGKQQRAWLSFRYMQTWWFGELAKAKSTKNLPVSAPGEM
eukprot:SAG25_NODE_434_length_8070_cov_90.584117_10_plen_279_part_00